MCLVRVGLVLGLGLGLELELGLGLVRVRVRVLEPVCAGVCVVDLRSVARHLPVIPSDEVGLRRTRGRARGGA